MIARRRRYRVAIVVPEFPRLSETFVVERMMGLLARGVDVHVICNRSPASEWRYFPALADGVLIRKRVHVRPAGARWLRLPIALLGCFLLRPHRCGRFVLLGWRRFGWRVAARLYEAAALVRIAPDVVHFEFGAVAVGREHWGRLVGCRSIVSFQGADANYVGLGREPGFYDSVWACVDAVHVVSRDLWERVTRRGCAPNVPHVVIAPIVGRAMIEASPRCHEDVAGTPERPVRLLAVGRLHWKRGLEYGVEVVRRLSDQGVACRLRVVGDGPFRDAVVFAARQLSVEPFVELLGSLAPAQVREELLYADVLLHPAVSEGFSLVALEAQALGLPVVATDADGLSENLADGETGFVVQRRHPDELTDRVARLARDPALRDRMGTAGRRRVAERFDRNKLLEAFDRFYESVVSGA